MMNKNITPLIDLKRPVTEIRPSVTYAFLAISPLVLSAIGPLMIAICWESNAMVILFILMVLAAFARFLQIRCTGYYLTAQQLIIRMGILSKKTHYLELYRIRDIAVSEPFLLRMLGLMDICLLAFDTEEPELVLKGIPTSELPQLIRDRVQACRQQNKILTVDR